MEVKKSNNLKYRKTKVINGESITVEISLNDECHNGHQDFHITGEIYQAGKPKTDRYMIACGCVHDEILKHFPEFDIFVRLHGCDYKGIQSAAVENGFYFLRNGFNSKSTGEAFKAEYCAYYRLTTQQFNKLYTAYNKLQFSLMLQNLGILDQWEEEADAAINYMEQLTGTKFVIDSTKSQYHAPTEDEINKENQMIASGYYTEAAKAAREEAKINQSFIDLANDRDKSIKKITNEYEAKLAVLKAGGKKALDNIIFYNHTNTVSFNWRNSDNLTTEEIEAITANLVLPDGVKWEISKNK